LCCCFFFCEKEASCNGNYISSNLAALMMIPSLLQHKVPAASKTCNSKTASKPALKSRSFPLLCVHASLSLSLSLCQLLSTWSPVHKMQCTFQALLCLYYNQIILLLLRLPNNLLP